MEELTSETRRLVDQYESWDRDWRVGHRSYFDGFFTKEGLRRRHNLERHYLRGLKALGLCPRGFHRVLDMGAGFGGTLRRFVEYGVAPSNLVGLDIGEARLRLARSMNPAISYVLAAGSHLPFRDNSFQIVILGAVFSSILSTPLRQALASEARRVLAEDGVILWYDYAIANLHSPDMRGVPLGELKELFSDCRS